MNKMSKKPTQGSYRDANGRLCRRKDASYVLLGGDKLSIAEYDEYKALSRDEKIAEYHRHALLGEGAKELLAYSDELTLVRANNRKAAAIEDPVLLKSARLAQQKNFKEMAEILREGTVPVWDGADRNIAVKRMHERFAREEYLLSRIIRLGAKGVAHSKYNRRIELNTEEGTIIFSNDSVFTGDVNSTVFGHVELSTIYATYFYLTAKRTEKDHLSFAVKNNAAVTSKQGTILLRSDEKSRYVAVNAEENEWAVAAAFCEQNICKYLSEAGALIPSNAYVRVSGTQSIVADNRVAILDIEINGKHALLKFPLARTEYGLRIIPTKTWVKKIRHTDTVFSFNPKIESPIAWNKMVIKAYSDVGQETKGQILQPTN